MKNFIITLLVSIPTLLSAQSAAIEGKVTDIGHKPLEFINVVLFNTADSTMVKAVATNASGIYNIDQLQAGRYFTRYIFMGYTEASSASFELSEGEIFRPEPMVMKPANTELEAVEVTFRKPLVQVEADKTIFNVEGTINSTGLDALELLRRAPGVMLDNNDNISVNGRSGIIVYIDGKLTPLDGDALKAMLKSMQSSNIESIEIITNPSAKYDAAGSAGIINIKLRKNRNFGTNGNVQLGYAVQVYSKYNGSISLNHRNAKFNVFGSYVHNDQKSWSWMDIDRIQDSTRYDLETRNVGDDKNHNYKGGIDYFINDRHTIGIMVNGNVSDNAWQGGSRTEIYERNGSDVESVLESRTRTTTARSNMNGNVNYHYADTSGRDLTIDVDYGDYSIRTRTFQPNTYTYPGTDVAPFSRDYRFITPIDITIMSFKSDYEQRAFGGKISGGVKLSSVETDNTMNRYDIVSQVDVLDSSLSNSFSYKENINAAYLNYNRQFSKLGVQLGLRGEHTKSNGELRSFIALSNEENRDVKRDYFNLFPSGALTYNVNDTNQFTLTFSRRIDRPSYQDLNPFEFKLDELSYQKGNAFLQPQFGHVVELTHTYMYALNTSLTYSYTTNFSANVIAPANDSASYMQERNLGFEEWIGMNISSPIPLNKWWNLFINANAGTKHVKSDTLNIDIRIYSYSFFGQSTFTLPKKYSIELSGWYSGPSVWGGTFVSKAMGGMDIAAKKDFWDGKASLRVAMGDVFYTMRWRSRSETLGIVANSRGGWESRQFRVSFSYNFGNQNVKSRQRKSGADDLNERVK